MKKKILFLKNTLGPLIILILTITNSPVSAQNPEFTTQGTDFWVTFGQNMRMENPDGDMNAPHQYGPVSLKIRIATKERTQVSFIFTDNPSYNTTITVEADTIETKILSSNEKWASYLTRPSTVALTTPYSNTSFKSIRVQSDKPISLYAISEGNSTADATNVFPAEALGKAYYHLSYKADRSTMTPTYSYTCFDGYAVIATKNNTIIYENGALKAVLQQGQVYYSFSAGAGELTGRYITSNHPVAYYVINTGTRIPNDKASTECLYQLLGPLNGWGTKFMVPMTERGKERVRIMASQNSTKITIPQASGYSVIGSSGSATLNNIGAGHYVELEINDPNTGLYFYANNPVQVCAYMMGATAFPGSGNLGDQGDPSMVLVPPIEQSVTSSTMTWFPMRETQTPITHHALIITPTDTRGQTTMAIGKGNDQSLSGGNWSTNTASGYSFYNLKLNEDKTYTFNNPAGLTVLGYAYGNSQSYYYLAGAATRNLNPHFKVNGEHYQHIQNKIFCTGDIDIEAVIYSRMPSPNSLNWFVDDNLISSVIDQTTWNVSSLGLSPGEHTILMEVLNHNNRKDSCIYYFTLIDPVTITGNEVLCSGDDLQLSGNSLNGEWTSNNTGIATVDQTGKVTGIGAGTAIITYRISEECFATKTITVNISPISAIHGAKSICLGTTTTLSGTPAGGTWSSNDPAVASVSSNGIVTSLSAGNVTFDYNLNGCTSTTEIVEIKQDCVPYEVWNWEDLNNAIMAINAGSNGIISLMQNIGDSLGHYGNGIGTGPNGEDCPHIEPEKKLGNYGYKLPAGGFTGEDILNPDYDGWTCPAITCDSLIFEGNGNTIYDIYYVGEQFSQLALFRSVNRAEFRNLSLKTTSKGFNYINWETRQGAFGGFVAVATDRSTFDNCSFNGRIFAPSVTQIGGFVGKAEQQVTIRDSYVGGENTSWNNTRGAGGFVGEAADGVSIERSVSEVTISSGAYIGGMVGASSNNIVISNSQSNARVRGMTNSYSSPYVGGGGVSYSENYVGGQIGGFVGAIYTDWSTANTLGSAFTGCTMTGKIESNSDNKKINADDYKNYAGGMVGFIGFKTNDLNTREKIWIDSCTMAGDIDATESFYVGGLLGGALQANTSGNITIEKSAVTGNIKAKRAAAGLTGEFGGNGNLTIRETYFRGNISADSSAGFIASASQANGNHNLLIIENSYVAGSIFGNNVAGLVYDAQANLDIQNSYEAVNLTQPGETFAGKGILLGNAGPFDMTFREIFYDNNLAGGVPHFIQNTANSIIDLSQPYITPDMIKESNFPPGWFNGTGKWAIVNGHTYPYLKWQATEDLSLPQNGYQFKSTEFRHSTTSNWTNFDISTTLPAAGNYSFRFISGDNHNASEAFFPYTPQKTVFTTTGNIVSLNGFTAQSPMVAGGVSESGIIGFINDTNTIYEVWNWEDFKLAMDAVNAGKRNTIRLMQDIGKDAATSGNGIGTGPNGEDCPHSNPAKKIGNYGYRNPIGGFFEMWPGREGWMCTGITADSLFFEGNGNTIDGLYFTGDDYDVEPALFGQVKYAEFRNLTVKTTGNGFRYGQNTYNAGGFVATALDAVLFENCHFDGTIYSMSCLQAGGFIGNAEKNVTIKNCSTAGKIELRYGNNSGAGGFVGNVKDGITIEKSVSDIYISTGSFAGGFVGCANNDISISNSVSNATIVGPTNWQPGWFVGSTWGYVGGYVGGTIGGIVGAIYTDRKTSQNNGSIITGTSMSGTLISVDTTYKKKPYYFKDLAGGAVGYIGSKYDTSSYHNTAAILIDTFTMKGHINAPESYHVGGLVGGINLSDQGTVTIRASNAVDNIVAQKKAGGLIGSVEGEGSTFIRESYFRGNISCDSSAGLVAVLRQTNGSHNLLTIENSYAAGSLFGNYVAGFVFDVQGNLLIDNSFGAINLTSPVDTFAGKGILLGIAGPFHITIREVFYDKNLAQGIAHIIQNNSGSLTDQAQPFSTFDMTLRTTYPGNWFSTGPWAIVNDQTYPYLKWQAKGTLTDPENNYAMASTEFSEENSGLWTVFKRIAPIPADGNYSFRFTLDAGDHAEEAFFPYVPQRIRFISTDTTVNLDGLSALDTIVACGVSQSGIIGIFYKGYTLYGTVYPYVKTQNSDFDTLFPVTALLYALPPADTDDPLGHIINQTPLYTGNTVHYDGTVFIPGTPKNPGSSNITDNPGLPINWNMIGKTQGPVDNTPLTESDNIPTAPIGLYSFTEVDSGTYILAISRPGFLTRYAKVTISANAVLGHRELLPGDVNGDFTIDLFDVSVVHAKAAVFPDPEYDARFDLNGDEKIDQDDVILLLFYIGADMEMYQETLEWLMEY